MFCPARVCPGTVLARYRPVRAGETRGDVAFRPLRNRFFNFSDFSCTATAQHGPLSRVVQFRSSRICEYMHVFRRLCLRGVNCGSTDLDSTVILTTVARDKGRYQTSTERPMPPDQSSPARSASIRRCTDTACVKQDAVRCRGEQGCVATSMNSCLRNGSELHPRTDWLCKLSVRVVVSAWGGAATRSEPLVQPHQQQGGGALLDRVGAHRWPADHGASQRKQCSHRADVSDGKTTQQIPNKRQFRRSFGFADATTISCAWCANAAG